MKFFMQVVSIPSLHAVYGEFRSGTDTTCMKNCLGYELSQLLKRCLGDWEERLCRAKFRSGTDTTCMKNCLGYELSQLLKCCLGGRKERVYTAEFCLRTDTVRIKKA